MSMMLMVPLPLIWKALILPSFSSPPIALIALSRTGLEPSSARTTWLAPAKIRAATRPRNNRWDMHELLKNGDGILNSWHAPKASQSRALFLLSQKHKGLKKGLVDARMPARYK